MKAPTLQVVTRLFALSRNVCAYPGCSLPIVDPSGTLVGDIAHIKASNPAGRATIPLRVTVIDTASTTCCSCADRTIALSMISRRGFTVEVLQEMKRQHEAGGRAETAPHVDRAARLLRDSYSGIHARDGVQVMIGSPGGVQARDITIKTGGKTPAMPLPTDAVGADIAMRSYIEYLNGRYIEYRNHGIRRGIDRRPFFSGMLHNLVKAHFGARTNLVPQHRFADLMVFMQRAIDNTIWGRNSRHRNYHSFDEHCARVDGTSATRRRAGTDTATRGD
jgi:hypothetical protein